MIILYGSLQIQVIAKYESGVAQTMATVVHVWCPH
jgi:hypothetical protein